jgi:hypothetical protein
MNIDSVIVTISVVGQPELIDIEIPDNRSCYDVVSQAINVLGLANMYEHRIESIEVVEPHSSQSRTISSDVQTVLAADIRDGAWLMVRLVRASLVKTKSMKDLQMAPTADSQGSSNITFQKRRVLHGGSVTRDD